ncbi:MAG: hypothetical protein ACOYN4_10055 [Bacteroidales bacterium]
MTEIKAKVNGVWQGSENAFKVQLPVIIFKDDNAHIMYCPALDLSGYGNNEDEAQKSFQVTLGEFFLYTLRKKTLESELKKLGWKLKSKHKPMTPPPMSKLLAQNVNFSNIFNNYSFRKIDEAFSLPV